MSRRTFIPRTDVIDLAARIHGIVKLKHRAAQKAEHSVDAIGFQHAIDGLSAVHFGHALLLASRPQVLRIEDCIFMDCHRDRPVQDLNAQTGALCPLSNKQPSK